MIKSKPIKYTISICIVVYALFSLSYPSLNFHYAKKKITSYQFNDSDSIKKYNSEFLKAKKSEIVVLKIENQKCTQINDAMIYTVYRSHHNGVIGDDGYKLLKIGTKVYHHDEGTCGSMILMFNKELALVNTAQSIEENLIKKGYKLLD